MSYQDQKNAKLLVAASIVLVVITLLMIFVVYPRDHGGYPAAIIGTVAIALFVNSIISLRKVQPTEQNATTILANPIDPHIQNSFISSSMPPPKVSVSRSVVGILVAGLGGYVAYIFALVIIRDLGALVIAPAAAIIVGFVALWRINKVTVLLAVSNSLLTVWLMYNLTPFGLHDDVTKYAIIGLLVVVAYGFHQFILGLVSKRFGLVFIAVTIVLGLTYMYAGIGLHYRESKAERGRLLQEIDFQYYLPSYIPAGYVLEEPSVAGTAFSDQKYIRTDLYKSGEGAIFVYQFRQLSLYKPPLDCGPENPIDTTPSSRTPCKEIAQSEVGCTVYREIAGHSAGFSRTEEELTLSNAYCSLKGTTIVINAYDYELNNEEIVKIFDSMTVANGR